ncbi:Coenzyme A biosynthesis bifunctional protein coaBC [Candidatus Protofrankia californiensis]|uniref:Coenzyme A biosynthesis bifunctional protein coaBC n=1 Tax=Candidatus Protofrankia californiensis TaxID=1839754 RepID=A0A1C3PB89_9ACTN|nr:Coenzyme A biosynthesis bifunctional protein coaBC [Candidatus Protofrankia californiensis]
MTEKPNRVLYVVVCAAGTAPYVGRLVKLAQGRGWDVCLVATPAAVAFLDVPALAGQSGHPVKSVYRRPGESRNSFPPADAVIVAPATYNTINKWAAGISDNYALGVLAEMLGLGVPVVVLPFVNTALAAHFAFRRSVTELTDAGVRVLMGPGSWQPHEPHTGGRQLDAFPWAFALDEAERATMSR